MSSPLHVRWHEPWQTVTFCSWEPARSTVWHWRTLSRPTRPCSTLSTRASNGLSSPATVSALFARSCLWRPIRKSGFERFFFGFFCFCWFRSCLVEIEFNWVNWQFVPVYFSFPFFVLVWPSAIGCCWCLWIYLYCLFVVALCCLLYVLCRIKLAVTVRSVNSLFGGTNFRLPQFEIRAPTKDLSKDEVRMRNDPSYDVSRTDLFFSVFWCCSDEMMLYQLWNWVLKRSFSWDQNLRCRPRFSVNVQGFSVPSSIHMYVYYQSAPQAT